MKAHPNVYCIDLGCDGAFWIGDDVSPLWATDFFGEGGAGPFTGGDSSVEEAQPILYLLQGPTRAINDA